MKALRLPLCALGLRATTAALAACCATAVCADTATTTAPVLNPTQAVSASANLRFTVSLGSFVSLRVGTAGTTVNTATFDLASLATGCTAGPCNFGNGTQVAATYDGGFDATGLPVEVMSNGGAVKLSAAATTPLTSGANSIPLSQIIITSSDMTNLPAPLVPDSGTGATVNIAETPSGSRITSRSANWTFKYANTIVPAAGAYAGQVTFTAATP